MQLFFAVCVHAPLLWSLPTSPNKCKYILFLYISLGVVNFPFQQTTGTLNTHACSVRRNATVGGTYDQVHTSRGTATAPTAGPARDAVPRQPAQQRHQPHAGVVAVLRRQPGRGEGRAGRRRAAGARCGLERDVVAGDVVGVEPPPGPPFMPLGGSAYTECTRERICKKQQPPQTWQCSRYIAIDTPH